MHFTLILPTYLFCFFLSFFSSVLLYEIDIKYKLPEFYPLFARILSAFYTFFALILPAFHSHFTCSHLLAAEFYPHFPSFHPLLTLFTRFLPQKCQQFAALQ